MQDFFIDKHKNGTLLTTLEFEKNVSDTGVVSETNKEK